MVLSGKLEQVYGWTTFVPFLDFNYYPIHYFLPNLPTTYWVVSSLPTCTMRNAVHILAMTSNETIQALLQTFA